MASDLTVRIESSTNALERGAWDALDHGRSPFLKWGFLAALERSRSISGKSGWNPAYILVERGGAKSALVGAVAGFVKAHSYGEYIFDWAWARAAARAGLPYYPKLVLAAPVTPVTGRRLLLAPKLEDPDRVIRILIQTVRELAAEADCASVHWLFTEPSEQETLRAHGFWPRASFQFHWKNDGYRDFDDFLSRLRSRKRKQVRKERGRARAAIDALEFVPGSELAAADIDAMDRYYRITVQNHGGMDYLRPGFFEHLVELLPEHVTFARARRKGETVAGALYLETDQALYGRYWGAEEDVDFLHFETAYYAGIERCIERQLQLFEAGAQGEHKLLRGFVPSPTYSSHSIAHPGLAGGVQRFLKQEAKEVETYMHHLRQYSPFKECADR